MRIALVLVLVACGADSGKPVPPAVPKPRVGDLGVDPANLSAQLPPFIDSIGSGDPKHAFSGYVLVAQHDQVIWRGAYGLADRKNQRVATSDTSFRIGSVTKQFTAAAILRLEQDGKLSVADTVEKHLPSYAGPGKAVTIHQLLTHTAGIPNYTADITVLLRKNERFTPTQLLETFQGKPLDFEPGSKFQYSNSGYAILGAIIERASGMSYGAYLKKMLFDPAQLSRTVVGDAEGDPDRAEGYTVAAGEIVLADPIDMTMPYAAGAVRSTANDMMRWHRALSGDTILTATQRAKLYKPALDHYAYAWVAAEVRGKTTVWHNGGIDGFGTVYWRVPDADLVVIAWTNLEGINIDQIGKAAIEAALGGTLKPVEKVKPGTVDPALMARVSGTFELAADEKARLVTMKLPQELIDTILSLSITPNNAGVTLKPNGQSEVELIPLADGTLWNADHQIRLRFTTPPAGLIATVVLEQGPLKITYQRK